MSQPLEHGGIGSLRKRVERSRGWEGHGVCNPSWEWGGCVTLAQKIYVCVCLPLI